MGMMTADSIQQTASLQHRVLSDRHPSTHVTIGQMSSCRNIAETSNVRVQYACAINTIELLALRAHGSQAVTEK